MHGSYHSNINLPKLVVPITHHLNNINQNQLFNHPNIQNKKQTNCSTSKTQQEKTAQQPLQKTKKTEKTGHQPTTRFAASQLPRLSRHVGDFKDGLLRQRLVLPPDRASAGARWGGWWAMFFFFLFFKGGSKNKGIWSGDRIRNWFEEHLMFGFCCSSERFPTFSLFCILLFGEVVMLLDVLLFFSMKPLLWQRSNDPWCHTVSINQLPRWERMESPSQIFHLRKSMLQLVLLKP